jgi:glycosyltransferase involved in cell wall biosynthesis
MGMLMLRELLRQGVEVDLYLATDRTVPPPISAMPGLRVITRRSRWQWNRWYSRTKATALFSSLAARSLSGMLLSVRLLIAHRRNPYDAVFQLSQMELFLLGRLKRWAPPIVVHPCSHAAGELRWHRAEQEYALRSERRSVHLAMRAWLELRSRLQPRELAHADLVVGPSNRYVDLVHEDYGVPRSKLRVLRHPVDLERFGPSASNGSANPRTLLFISRISARKGVEDIVALSHRLADLAGSVRLLVVGGVTLWSDYSAHLADLHPGVAEYAGSVSSEEMPELMRSAAMLLVPSRYEPGSIVTGEALASGLPVVLSDEVGPSEILAGPHIRVHRAGDVDGLEAAVRSLLRDLRHDGQALRDAARADAEAHFAVRTVVGQLIDIISSVAPGPATRSLAGADELVAAGREGA